MRTITLQYLEDSPDLAQFPPESARSQLRAAAQAFPYQNLVIGWRVPPQLVAICRAESSLSGAALYRWQPLLAGDGTIVPRTEWQVIGLNGEPVAGYKDLPEFTLICPNRRAVELAVMGRLNDVLQSKIYQGIFLDRMRYPSPAPDPLRNLGCFCPACRKKAAACGLDLEEMRTMILKWATTPAGARELVRFLLKPAGMTPVNAPQAALSAFLRFRSESITRFIQKVTWQIRAAELKIGLDCFSPLLSRSVAQNLVDLSRTADWVKVMTYAHARGPAGLPFELGGYAQFLMEKAHLSEAAALEELQQICRIPLPATRAELLQNGLPSATLQSEVTRATAATQTPIYAGMELVEVPGVAELHPARIREDLAAFSATQAAGLALAWDLRYIPPERLAFVKQDWK